MSSQQVAVFGAGATGCYLAAQLSLAGFEVTLICRERIKQQIETNDGLTITHYSGSEYKVKPANIITHVGQIQQYFEMIFVTLKCHQLASIQADLLKISHQNSHVIFMQNGLNSADELIDSLYPRPCFFGITPFNVVQLGNGHYHQATEGKFIFPQVAALEGLIKRLNASDNFCQPAQDIDAIINGKLLLNINNGLNAICDLPLKTQLSQRRYRRLLAQAMQEWLTICQALDLPVAQLTKVKPHYLPRILGLPDWIFTRIAKQMLDIDPKARSSMWQDIQAKRKTEIEFINGAIVALGKEHRIATPVNLAICKTIAQLEQGQAANIDTLVASLTQ